MNSRVQILNKLSSLVEKVEIIFIFDRSFALTENAGNPTVQVLSGHKTSFTQRLDTEWNIINLNNTSFKYLPFSFFRPLLPTSDLCLFQSFISLHFTLFLHSFSLLPFPHLPISFLFLLGLLFFPWALFSILSFSLSLSLLFPPTSPRRSPTLQSAARFFSKLAQHSNLRRRPGTSKAFDWGAALCLQPPIAARSLRCPHLGGTGHDRAHHSAAAPIMAPDAPGPRSRR